LKPCPSFPGYFIDDKNHVVSARRRKTPHPLREFVTRKGYHEVQVVTPTGIRPVGVHAMVADAHHGPKPFDGAVARHLDGNPSNNEPANIVWGTHKENAEDRIRHGRYANGGAHHNAKLTNAEAEDVRVRRNQGEKVRAIAGAYGVSIATIESIIYGKAYRCVEFRKLEATK
jgi:hypothetical protein